MAAERVLMNAVLTNVTVVSQQLFSSIPRRNFHKLPYMTRGCASKEGNVVEKDFVALDFDVVRLVQNGANMNVPADGCAGVIGRLAPIHLVVDV
jgi:hypothetical protein